ncbi:uncharacterized protein TrAtP1_010259 [Trichoderma atroviride]|uniref:uncharacterized protein n=1 Tax=Hypocrea atroviridis TaxID=63577 RepID=UPI003327E12C|nr:hypothetical protein TrAtP1_010259 [Trichoderma atroviride]
MGDHEEASPLENLFPRMATDGPPRCLLQLLGNAGRELTATEHRGVSFSISRGFGCIITLCIGIVLLIARRWWYWMLDVVLVHSTKTTNDTAISRQYRLPCLRRQNADTADKNVVIKTNMASSPFAF